jgi:hypothetical protein
MLYSLIVLFFGIYLGQEYPGIPSIKMTYLESVKFLKQGNSESEDKSNTEAESEAEAAETKKSLVYLIKSLLNKTKAE